MLPSRAQLRALTHGHIVPFLERALRRRWAARVQRFGTQAWVRVTARWPALGELLRPIAERVAPPNAVIDARVIAVDGARPSSRARATREKISVLLEDLELAPTWQERARAAARLARYRGPRVVDGLLDALHDPSAEVAVSALEALAEQEDARVDEAFVELLRNVEGCFGPVTRAAAVGALARRSGAAALPLLLEAVDDVDGEVSIAAIFAASQVAPEPAAARLVALLRDDTGYFLPGVRIAAARTLERSRTLRPTDARALLGAETDPDVREILRRVLAGD